MIPFIGAWLVQWRKFWQRRSNLFGAIALSTALAAAVFQLSGHKSYDKHFWLLFAMSSNIALLSRPALERFTKEFLEGAPRRVVSASVPQTQLSR